jgi:hypothetical protein
MKKALGGILFWMLLLAPFVFHAIQDSRGPFDYFIFGTEILAGVLVIVLLVRTNKIASFPFIPNRKGRVAGVW